MLLLQGSMRVTNHRPTSCSLLLPASLVVLLVTSCQDASQGPPPPPELAEPAQQATASQTGGQGTAALTSSRFVFRNVNVYDGKSNRLHAANVVVVNNRITSVNPGPNDSEAAIVIDPLYTI